MILSCGEDKVVTGAGANSIVRKFYCEGALYGGREKKERIRQKVGKDLIIVRSNTNLQRLRTHERPFREVFIT